MDDKRNPGQRGNPKQEGDGSPAKYFGAIKAWVDNVEQLDDEFEDIQLNGNITRTNPLSGREPNQSRANARDAITAKYEGGERAIDEANDNINVTGMLHNIMEALKVDDNEKKPAAKKRVYSPLVRVKRVEEEPPKPVVYEPPKVVDEPTAFEKLPFIQKPTVSVQKPGEAEKKDGKGKKESDLQIIDFEKSPIRGGNNMLGADHSGGADESQFFKSGGFNSSVQAGGGVNPFAKAYFPSTKINDNQIQDRGDLSPQMEPSFKPGGTIPSTRKMQDPNQSTIGDLSAIAADTGINRDTLDSRGSFVPGVNLFGQHNHRNSGGADQILTPGIQIIDSPDRIVIQDQEDIDSGIFKKPESPIRIDTYGEAHLQPPQDNNVRSRRNNSKSRPSQAIELLAQLAADDKLGETEDKERAREAKSKEKKDKTALSRFFGGNKKKNAKASAAPNASATVDDLQAEEIDEANSPGAKLSHRPQQAGDKPQHLGDRSQQAGDMETREGDMFNAHELPSQRVHLSGLPKDPEVSEYKSHRPPISRQSLLDSQAQSLNKLTDRKEGKEGKGRKEHEEHEIQATKPIAEQANEDEIARGVAPHVKLVDETQDTGTKGEIRPTSAMSDMFKTGNLGNSMMLAKDKAKGDDKSDRSFPLSKKVTGEGSELRFEEESPLMINFTKRDVQEEESFMLDHDNSQAEDFFGEKKSQRSKRSESIIELEEFDVPVSSSMINLFVGFKRKVNRLEDMYHEVRKPEYTIDTFFERNLSFFNGKLKITKNFFFIFLILTGVMLFFIFDTLSANDLSRVKNDSEKKFVAELFIPAAIIFTYYGIAFLYIKIKWLYWVVIPQILICLGVIGAELGITFVQDKSFNYTPVYICGFIIGTNVFWAITRFLRQDILRNYSWAWSIFYMLSWCILVPTAIIAYGIYVSVVSRRFNYSWANQLAISIGVPFMILLCLTWVYYHYKFFVPASKKKAALEKKPSAREVEKENEEKLREQFGDISEDEEEKKEEEKKPLKLRIYVGIKTLLKKISDIIIIVSSFSLGGSLVFIEGVLLVYITRVTTTESVSEPGALYLAIFLLFFIPFTVFSGIPIVANGKNHEKKMFLVPALVIWIPLFIMMPISNTLMNDGSDGHSIGLFLILAPGISTIFWLTMSYIGNRRKKTKFGSLGFLFICFVIPLVILQPLITSDAFTARQVAQGFAAFFLAVGIIILVILFAYLITRAMLIKEITQKDRLNTDNYKLINVFKTNLEPFGYWANSMGFIINFTLSLYTLFHAPDGTSEGLRGMALGISLVYILFYIYNAVALKVKIIETTEISKYGIKSLSAAIIESVRNNELFDEMQAIRNSNEKLKGFVRLFTYLCVPVTAILSLALASSNDFGLGVCATLCIGTIIIHILFEIYCGFKIKYTNIAKSAVALLLTYFWFTHALAFSSVLHYTRIFFADDSRKKERIEVQLIVLVFVITVSIIAIIANIIFKGIELEQKIKYILAYIRKQLENIAVKSDYFVLQKVFDGWMEHGENKLKKMLVNRGKPAFWWPVPATNPNTKYSKVLLDFDAYSYMKLRLKQKLDNEEGKGLTTKKKPTDKSCFSKFLGCLGCCLPFLLKQKRPGFIDDELNEEIEELLDLQMHEVPLPPKEEGEESDEDSDDDYDPGDLGDWQIESKIAENKIEITDTQFRPLDERVLRAMMYYDSGIKFAHNDKFTVDFLKFVYRLFAVGNYRLFKKRWLDYLGYKRFMILAAITPTPEFPDYMIDLVYTQYTHNVGRGQIARRVDYSQKKQAAKKKVKKNVKEVERDQKMRLKVFPVFEEDFEGFLIHIAKRRFPNEINDRDALYRLIRWHLFPNFLHLLPSVQKEYPHEYDYLLYLIDLYMKQDKAAALAAAGLNPEDESNANGNGTGANANGIDLEGKDGNETNRLNGDGTDPNGLGKNGKGVLGDLDDSREARGPNCISCIISSICGALTKCTLYFAKKISDFFSSFFFLKTNAQKKADKEFEDMQRKSDKEEKEEVKKIRADKIAETNLGDDAELNEEELNKKGQFRRKRRTYPHKPSPDWPIVVETIIKSLKDAENDYENRKAANKQPYFIPSIRNIVMLLTRIIEVYALASLAFRKEVPWGWSDIVHDVFAFPSGSSDLYLAKVWTSLGFAVFYCYIGLTSISFAKEGILGADKATRKAGEFPSRGFAHSIILTIFSTVLSVWIIKTFLDLFSCDYYQDVEVLFFMPSVECGSTLHHWWLVLASFGLLLYYPISSFLWPNLQYLNVGNDFKYDTSFIVMFNQAKLIMIAVTVFFPYTNEVLVPLVVSAVLFIALAVINKLLQPNCVIVLNLWETSMFFIGAWIQISGIIAHFSGSAALPTTLLLLGIAVILLLTYVLHRYQKIPHSYEKIPQAQRQDSVISSKQESPEMVKKYHHEPKDSELPLAPLDRPGMDLTERDGEEEPEQQA